MANRRFHLITLGLLLPVVLGCSSDELEQLLEEGELRVLTRNTGTTYYEGPDGPTGLEYDLASGFAAELGVEVRMIPAGSVTEVLERLGWGEAHFAAAGLTVTELRRRWARFTPPYQSITQQLVYRLGSPRPTDIGDLSVPLVVLANSSHLERLQELKQQHPNLQWVENREVESEELLTLVGEKAIDYTVADSNEVTLNQRFHPELRIAFDLSNPQPLAWAFPRSDDDSLYEAACDYFDRLQKSGRLSQLLERYYGHLNDFDYVGTRTFLRDSERKLPLYRPLFEAAAEKTGLDWRLLAAMAYQESHWNPKAVSPTGVRGIMMLTQATAAHIGVTKRTDAAQSIDGGSRYLRRLLDRMAPSISAPDRLWMALAAYNVGIGHLEDARLLTERRGGDPNSWSDLKETLPLLRQRKWYRQTRHGYARGNEPVIYVENVRSYYDILLWQSDQEKKLPEVPVAPELTTAVAQ